ncbi:hypothetical protein PVAR5_7707 [Paecilomyces variotii No. 5]|uniref:Uncharacterized protein n=1 Tax=Byssochlamys spectabilis (strain No. 5 / NBRC 109023) TaxID=1356009 RepID=V5GDK0_BYSSN|nr:hypothetical protein PVAR5_7707 [Paecilomyces variotii No. 5]
MSIWRQWVSKRPGASNGVDGQSSQHRHAGFSSDPAGRLEKRSGDGRSYPVWQNGAESSTDSDRWRAQERRRAVHAEVRQRNGSRRTRAGPARALQRALVYEPVLLANKVIFQGPSRRPFILLATESTESRMSRLLSRMPAAAPIASPRRAPKCLQECLRGNETSAPKAFSSLSRSARTIPSKASPGPSRELYAYQTLARVSVCHVVAHTAKEPHADSESMTQSDASNTVHLAALESGVGRRAV